MANTVIRKNSIKGIKQKLLIIISIILLALFFQACTGSSTNADANADTEADSGQDLGLTDNFIAVQTITLSPKVPLDINDPTDLAEAAAFAWKEFIALTWPAQAQGPTAYPRGKALETGRYGDKGPTGQVVWETYRHRVEAFPAEGNPNGYDAAKPDYGFASAPKYIYDTIIPPLTKGVDPNKVPPFINLDEVTQITLNAMYSGAYGHHTGSSKATVEDQKILFLAKVNETYYKYVAENKFFDSGSDRVKGIIANSGSYAETGDGTKYPPPYTNLPVSNAQTNTEGAIEIKAAWRKLNPDTEDISTFYTSPVRYYEGIDDGTGGPPSEVDGYVDSDDPGVNEIWGLVAIHIIHKTPNAPAFVYATFSHYNNILDAEGNSVEDKDGTTFPKYLDQEPFSPSLNIINAPANEKINQKVYTVSGSVNTNSPQLYFQNSIGKEAINVGSTTGPLYKDPVVMNRRLYPIPPTIVNANKTAHDAIKAANPDAVWQNYKLVNVQAEPLDYVQDSVRIFEEGGLAPTYFLSNELVESNPSLQNFSGALFTNGEIANFAYNALVYKAEYDYNVFIRSGSSVEKVNMGGCMGCHGSQGQKAGGDFSVLLARGRIAEPDVIQLDVMSESQMLNLTQKYSLKTKD